MKTILLFLSTLVFTTGSFAQELKLVQIFYVKNKQLKEEYQIVENTKIREGFYKSYYADGRVQAKGNYKNNSKVGLWEYKKEDGWLIEQYDHDLNVVIKQEVKRIIRYPLKAMQNGIEGEVLVRVQYDEQCNMVEVQVEKGLGFGCDEAAIYAFKHEEELRKKYSIKPEPCTEKQKLLPIRFRLQ